MSAENKIGVEGIDPTKLQESDDLVFARILSGAPDPNDVGRVMKVTACIATCLAQMIADPTPAQAENVRKHLLGHVAHDTKGMLESILGQSPAPTTGHTPTNRVKNHLN